MNVEFSGVSEKIHGVIASNSLCYQCLFGRGGDMTVHEERFREFLGHLMLMKTTSSTHP